MSIQDEQWYNFLSKYVADTDSGGVKNTSDQIFPPATH